MKKVAFPFQREKSSIFGYVDRPVAPVCLWSFRKKTWENLIVLVDSGADYSLLPHYLAQYLGINLKKECEIHPTAGVGGTEKVCLFRNMPLRISSWEGRVPIGFLGHDDIPPLLGRQGFLDKVGVVFHKRRTIFVF